MKVTIYRRKGETPYWQAQVYVGGKRYRFSCQTDDKATAREYARQRVEELKARHNRGLTGLPDSIRISQVFDRYEREALPNLRPSSQLRALAIVNRARSWFVSGPLRDPNVAHIQASDIAAFLETRKATGVKPRTVNLHRAILHRIFRLCVRPWLLIPSNPVSATEPLREEPREPRLLSDPEYAALIAASADHPMLRLFVTLAWETGARSGELLQLEWADVDFEHLFVTFANDPTRGRQTKGRRSRTLPLSPEGMTALRDHAAAFRLSDPRSPYVFKLLRPDRSRRPGDRILRLYDALKAAAKTAGFPKLRPHDLLLCTPF